MGCTPRQVKSEESLRQELEAVAAISSAIGLNMKSEDIKSILKRNSFADLQTIASILQGDEKTLSTHPEEYTQAVKQAIVVIQSDKVLTAFMQDVSSKHNITKVEAMEVIAAEIEDNFISGKETTITTFFNNLDAFKKLSGSVRSVNQLTLKQEVVETEGGSLTLESLSIRDQRHLDEGLTTALFSVMTTSMSRSKFVRRGKGSPQELNTAYEEYLNRRLKFRMSMSEIMDLSMDSRLFNSKMKAIYGDVNTVGTVMSYVNSDIVSRYNELKEAYREAPKNSEEREELREEIQSLAKVLKYIRAGKSQVIIKHAKFLNRLGLSLNSKDIIEAEELEKEDETNPDHITSRDSLGIASANEINPLTRVNPHLKLLLKTLPLIDVNGNNKVNSLGVSTLASYGQTMSILFDRLANTGDNIDKILELQQLAKEDGRFKVLLERLGLKNFTHHQELNNLTRSQFNLFTSFMTAFNTAHDSYKLLNVTADGNRMLIDSNREQVDNIIKSKWSENFKYSLQKSQGLGHIVRNKHVLNLSYEYQGKALRDWFKGITSLDQKLDLLNVLGVNFPTRDAVLNIMREDDVYATSINWLFNSLIQDPNLSDIMEGNESGNLRNLLDLRKDTDITVGSLQHVSIKGKKTYSITLKGFVNTLADILNTDTEMLENSPTFLNSVYKSRLDEGSIMEIGVIDGAIRQFSNRGQEISSTSEANIVLLHTNSILEGAVPLIRTGNKKLEKTIKVGDPNYARTSYQMVEQLLGYLESEIRTAHKIRSEKIYDIKGLKNGDNLQYFSGPMFTEVQTEIDELLDSKILSEEKLGKFLNSVKLTKPGPVGGVMEKFLQSKVLENLKVLEKYNMIKTVGGKIQNIGLDMHILRKIEGANAMNLYMGEEDSTVHLDDKGVMSQELFSLVANHLTYIREEGMIEQFKIVLGHPSLYGDLFKRTSGLVSPKKFPDSSDFTMNLLDKHYPNMSKSASGSVYGAHSNTVRFITRTEVTEDSVYLSQYIDNLNKLGKEHLIDIVAKTYKDMEVFDGGGFIALDFYRKARVLTDSWSKELENLYQKIVLGEELDVDTTAMFSPLKPQVLAAINHKGIDIRMFNKFALYPLHPNLSKLTVDRNSNTRNVLDNLYEDLIASKIDYMVFPSGTKLGAKYNQDGKFDDFVDANGEYSKIKDYTSVQEYDLKFFGIQQDPKDSRSTKVPAGTQSTTMIPTNIYNNGVVSKEYAKTAFSEYESWDQAIDRYHGLTGSLIERDMSRLAHKLGFVKTHENTFRLLDADTSRSKMKASILEEMSRRDIPENTKHSIETLFDSVGTNFINQLFEKGKIEIILNAIITNTVIQRKMNGEQVVLQSNLGLKIETKATKQKNSSVNLNRKLKFYEIEAETGKTMAMEVYLPHYFKKYLGQEVDINKVSSEALELIGFRIPTEGLNSIEFIKVVGFLPQSAGSTIIVPSEMVAKSGADYDIDKLTLYMPHTTEVVQEDSNGVKYSEIQVIHPIQVEEGAFISPEEISRLRTLDKDTYRVLLTKLFDMDTAMHLISTNNLNESGVTKLDTLLSEQDFSHLKDHEIQPRQILQNQVLDFMKELLSHPASFSQLITPVGALDLATMAKEIHKMKNPDMWEVGEQGVQEVQKLLHEMVSFPNMINTTYTMYQTLGGTGVVASSMTHAIKSQRAGLTWNSDAVLFNFKGVDHENVSLSRTEDFDGNLINSSMQKYISGYVDGEKDPFVMYVNAGKDLASVHMALLRTGIPLETVLLFMSQPIIDEYVKIMNVSNSEAVDSKARVSDYDVVEILNASVLKQAIPTNEELHSDLLEEMLSKDLADMSPIELNLQSQILGDMLRYKQYGVNLMELGQVTSYDTDKLQNGSEVIFIKALERKVRNEGMFVNDSHIANETPGQSSFLKPLRDTFMNSRILLSNMDLKNSSSAIHEKYITLAEDLIERGVYKENVTYHLNQFDNFLSSYIILEELTGPVKLSQEASALLVGEQSVPRRLKTLQEEGVIKNLALDNFISVLDVYKTGTYDATVDSLKLAGSKYDIEDLNDMVEEMKNLKITNPILFEDIIKLSLLQSGMNFSPYAFHQILPGEDVLGLTSDKFTNFMTRMGGEITEGYFNEVYDSFLDNSWHNPRIIERKYTSDVSVIKKLNAESIELEELPGYISHTLREDGSRVVVAHTRDESNGTVYYDYLKNDAGTIVKAAKRGVKHLFIETGDSNILASNLHSREGVLLHVPKKAEDLIREGKQTAHLMPTKYNHTSGRFRLKGGTILDMEITKVKHKTLIADSNKGQEMREKLGITEKNQLKNPILALAKMLGYKSVAGMKNSNTVNKSFFKNYAVNVGVISVEKVGEEDILEEGSKQGSISELASKIKTDTRSTYNKKNNCYGL